MTSPKVLDQPNIIQQRSRLQRWTRTRWSTRSHLKGISRAAAPVTSIIAVDARHSICSWWIETIGWWDHFYEYLLWWLQHLSCPFEWWWCKYLCAFVQDLNSWTSYAASRYNISVKSSGDVEGIWVRLYDNLCPQQQPKLILMVGGSLFRELYIYGVQWILLI